ncbi:MAG: DUF4296 domain-containing protein [Prevotellaceae bacterium]|nr:DUF4296 domain-containing protein [Prevotellaceae bacterium]
MRRTVGLLMLSLCLLLLASCKPGTPKGILSSGKMEDVLFDYHIAQAMAQQSNRPEDFISYRAAVLKKHDVTEAEFDSSMVYYERHTELLQKIYGNLADRMQKEAAAQGASAADMSSYGMTANGDTASIWTGLRAMVFSPDKPFNYAAYSLKADTAYHPGDRLILDFDAQFIYQDGVRNGIAVLAVQFANDSVATQVVQVQSDSHYSLQVEDTKRLGIKSVRGFFLLSKGNEQTEGGLTTLKLMFIENIRLVRMHIKNEPTNGINGNGITNGPSAGPGMPSDSGGGPRPVPIQGAPVPAGVVRQ